VRDLDMLRTFANTLKYRAITLFANLGNMISIARGTLLLPFLPLLVSHILLNKFRSDFPSIAINNVDPDSMALRQDLPGIQADRVGFGLVSTVFDLLTFVLLVYVFPAQKADFQSARILISRLTALTVMMVLGTRRPACNSTPGIVLAISNVIVAVLSLALLYLGGLSGWLGLTPLAVASDVGGDCHAGHLYRDDRGCEVLLLLVQAMGHQVTARP
jgi:Mg2+-importing ATPase